MNLENLTPESILYGEIPMDDLLIDSLYYPACLTDGRPIKFCNTMWRKLGINSFVYCDFDLSEEAFIRELSTIRGYHVVAHRSLKPSEYLAPEWKLELLPEEAPHYKTTFLGRKTDFPPFGHWAVMERDDYKNELYGPKAFSLIYIGGEALATFQNLYCSRGIRPKMLCLIQCGGFAGNWTSFANPQKSSVMTLRKHPECIPEYVCLGSYNHIDCVQRILGTEYLGVKLAGYDLFKDQSSICISSTCELGASVLEHMGRKYLKLRGSMGMCPVVYDITESKFDVNTIVNNLIMREKEGLVTEADVLNDWIGFEKPTHKHWSGAYWMPNLSLEVQRHPESGRKYTADAINVIDAVYDMCIERDIKFYTERMMDYLQCAYWLLPDAKESWCTAEMTLKRRQCERLIKRLELFCKKI